MSWWLEPLCSLDLCFQEQCIQELVVGWSVPSNSHLVTINRSFCANLKFFVNHSWSVTQELVAGWSVLSNIHLVALNWSVFANHAGPSWNWIRHFAIPPLFGCLGNGTWKKFESCLVSSFWSLVLDGICLSTVAFAWFVTDLDWSLSYSTII